MIACGEAHDPPGPCAASLQGTQPLVRVLLPSSTHAYWEHKPAPVFLSHIGLGVLYHIGPSAPPPTLLACLGVDKLYKQA